MLLVSYYYVLCPRQFASIDGEAERTRVPSSVCFERLHGEEASIGAEGRARIVEGARPGD
jgi:hypothetical protein